MDRELRRPHHDWLGVTVRTADTLFVAMTRPQMKWGVPWSGFVANIGLTFATTVIIIHRPPGFFLGIGIHLALRELSRTDPHFFGKWQLFFQTKAKSLLTWATWGGSKLQPSPTYIASAVEMRNSV